MNFMPRFHAEVLSVFRLRTICPCDNLNNCPGYQVGTSEVLCLKRPASTAGVAQSVEHLICNQGVGGSNPFASSRKRIQQAAVAAQQVFRNALHSEVFPCE